MRVLPDVVLADALGQVVAALLDLDRGKAVRVQLQLNAEWHRRPGEHRVHRTRQFASPFEGPFDFYGETDGALALARHEPEPEPGFSPEFRLSQARLLKAVPDYVTVPGMASAPAYGRP